MTKYMQGQDMRERTVIIEDYGTDREKEISRFLKKSLEGGVTELTVVWKFDRVSFRRKTLESMAGLLSSLGREQDFFLNNVIRTRDWRALLIHRRFLNRYGFEVYLELSVPVPRPAVGWLKKGVILERLVITEGAFAPARELYRRYRAFGISMEADAGAWTVEEFKELFREWADCRKDCWLTCFQDYFTFFLIGMRLTECEYDSCMGKYLLADREGQVYFCRKKRAGSRMYHVDNIEAEGIYNGVYADVLKKAVERRRSCRETCGEYMACQGGCPLTGEQPCGAFREKLRAVAEFFQKNMETMFMDVENPHPREFLLSAVGFGLEAGKHTNLQKGGGSDGRHSE